MSKKIYLSPSNQSGNLYAYGNTNECEQCNRIAEATEKALKRCGFDVKRAAKGQEMKTSIQESNTWGADLHIPIHTNAITNTGTGTAGGTLVIVHSNNDANIRIATPIYNAVQAVTPGKTDYGIQTRSELAELNSTNAIAVYIEVDFHDNPPIAKWLVENPVTVGEAIAQGVCKAFNVEYVAAAAASKPSKNVFYRVQVGAYNSKNLAEELLKSVKKAGFTNAFIVEVKK